MATTEDPHYVGVFMYGDGVEHCWSGPVTTAERLKEIASYALRHMPPQRTAPWWRYQGGTPLGAGGSGAYPQRG